MLDDLFSKENLWKLTFISMESHNNRHMRVNKSMELDKQVSDELRIAVVNVISEMKPEYKNKR